MNRKMRMVDPHNYLLHLLHYQHWQIADCFGSHVAVGVVVADHAVVGNQVVRYVDAIVTIHFDDTWTIHLHLIDQGGWIDRGWIDCYDRSHWGDDGVVVVG